MREYKFRAYDRVENKMISFEELVERSSLYDFSDEFIDPFNEMIGEYESPRIYMQYTGQKDKNGREIYEGDIFHLGDINIRYIVNWTDTGFMGRQIGTRSCVGLDFWKDRIKIIGNIFNDPELLEVEK